MRARKALFLTHTAPLPLVSGERIRSFHLMRELDRKGWDVSLFSLLHSVQLGARDEDVLRALCDDVLLVPFEASAWRRATKLARAMIARRPFQERYFFSSEAARRLLAELPVDEFDALVPVTRCRASRAASLRAPNSRRFAATRPQQPPRLRA